MPCKLLLDEARPGTSEQESSNLSQGSKLCKFCDHPITSPHAKTFCDRSCAAKFNNTLRKAIKHCEHCNGVLAANRNRFCNSQCAKDYEFETVTVERIQLNEVDNRKTLRRYIEKTVGWLCSNCNRTEWEGEPIPLELHHKDADASNNRPDNICLICPNCHALTDSWKGRNIGQGRKSRGVVTY